MSDKVRRDSHSHLNQAGMVSIMVTLIMMIVISLTVLGFAQVARRNSREALDRQLSSQAYYAAESGVNDVLTAVKAGQISDLNDNTAYRNSCTGANPSDSLIGKLMSVGISNVVSASNNTSYTCVLVNPKPKSLPVNVTNGVSQVVPLNLSGTLGTLNFSWPASASGAVTNCPTAVGAVFTPAPTWTCSYGVLRVDLVDTSGVSNYNSTTLTARTISLFVVPTNHPSAYTSTAVDFGSGTQQVYVVPASCDATSCIASVHPNAGSSSYQARLSGVYKDLGTVTITGKDTLGTDETFTGAQLVIDSTGKAQDELRRIQVRVRLTGSGNVDTIPTNALQSSGGICKRFTILNQQPNDRANGGDDSNIPTEICSP